jgi:hypothetical protein
MHLRPFVGTFFAALTFTLASGCVAASQAPRGEPPVVDQQDSEWSGIMTGLGYTRRNVLNGSLGSSRSREFIVDVPASQEVSVLGFCDMGCSDLDLLISRGETILDSDTEGDDQPELLVKGHRGGRLAVVVSMADCDRSSCQFRAIVFTR